MDTPNILPNITNYFIDRPIQIIKLIQTFNIDKVKYLDIDVEFF